MLRELTARALDAHLSKQQQELTYTRKEAGSQIKVSAAVKFFVPFIADETGMLVRLGKGLFRLPTPDDVDEEEAEAAAVDAADEGAIEEGEDFSGWIYAFSFPMIQRQDSAFPIKVGKTTTEVSARVAAQCKSSSAFEQPIVLGNWKVGRMSHMESAIHNVLKARGRWRKEAPGSEWFDTTIAEIESIIKFIGD